MINLGLIGPGKWGGNYLSEIKSIKGCQIKYVASKTRETLNSITGNYIKTTNFKEFLSYKDLDGVIIATPASTHFEISLPFLEKGIPVLIEKPFTVNAKEAEILRKIAKKKKSVAMVGHVYLFDPSFNKALEVLNEIGKIRSIFFEGEGNFLHEDTSVLWDWGPHAISLLLKVLKKDPQFIQAWGETLFNKNYDTIFARLSFPSGIKGFVKASRVSLIKKRQLIIEGTKGTIQYSDLSKKVKVYKRHTRKPENEKIINIYNSNSPLREELRAFIKSIKNNSTPKSDLAFSLKVIKILEKAEKSLRLGGKNISF